MSISTMSVKYVAYYRVSTKKQGRSGLGLEAQQKAVRAMAERHGGTIIAEYIEVETGKSATRPKLLEAIHHAGLTNSTLVVAKLDRLARNAHFTRTLKESRQRFVCCDNEHATDLTIDLLAVIAEHRRGPSAPAHGKPSRSRKTRHVAGVRPARSLGRPRARLPQGATVGGRRQRAEGKGSLFVGTCPGNRPPPGAGRITGDDCRLA